MTVSADFDLDNLEERFASLQESEGYKDGLIAGERAGLEEGQEFGAVEGAKKGAEIGYFKGFTMTYKITKSSSSLSRSSLTPKSEKLYDEILRLIDEFPNTNETNCEDKLAKIRVKFRQAFVNVSHPTVSWTTAANRKDKSQDETPMRTSILDR